MFSLHSSLILMAILAVLVSAMPANRVEKRLLAAPSPTIPAGLNNTGAGCFDAGDCFAYQYPDFAAQCISGKCYAPITHSDPLGLPTLAAFGASSASQATATPM